jgi:hypothetical protein
MMPEEKVKYQEKDISDMAQQSGLQLLPEIPGARNNEILNVLTRPANNPLWKGSGKGSFQDIFFLTTLDKTPEFVKSMFRQADSHGYPAPDIGIYIQPVHQGTSCHCEFTLPYDPDNTTEVSNIQELFKNSSRDLAKQGAYFSRPYGFWADMMFNRDARTTITLKKLKEIFDPNNIMNPGKLCF